MRIGITGNIATGKNLVAKYFEELGAYIIDADEVYHKLIYPGKPLWRKLVEEFGSTIIHPQGMIDRKRLGDIVFNNKEALKKLNTITHKEIIKELEKEAKKYEKEYKIVGINAALLIEAGAQKLVDKIIVVWTDEDTQIKRLTKRDNISEEEARKRIKAQMPLSEKLKYGDYIINNNGTPEQTKKQVERIYKELIEGLV